MQITLEVKKKDGSHLAVVSVLKNGTTVVTHPHGSTHVHYALYELLHELVEQHREVHIVARHKVG